MLEPGIRPIPIIDPVSAPPVYLPTRYPQEPIETAFPTEQRLWIRERDMERCQMPIFENGEFVGFANERSDNLTVHHITPEYYYKVYRPYDYRKRFQNNPLNGVTLSRSAHEMIHRDWIDSYKNAYLEQPERLKRAMGFETWVTWQTRDQGCPAWVTKYDKYFLAVSTINTYWQMHETGTFPFSDHFVPEIERQYELLLQSKPDFVERYLRVTRGESVYKWEYAERTN